MQNNNFSIWDTEIYSKEEFEKLNVYEQLKYLCLLGSLAPSTHNTQPWRFKIDKNQNSINIYVDKAYILPASDVDGRQTAISIGCAIKNITIGAGYFGLSYDIKIIAEKKDDWKPLLKEKNEKKLMLAAIIKLKTTNKANNNPYNPIKDIFNRKIMRAEYDPHKKIESSIIENIKNKELTNNKDLKLHLITDQIRKLIISEFQGQADGFVINSKKFSRELGDWLLPNDTSSYIGMPGIGFGLQNQEAARMHRGLVGEEKLQPEDGLRFSLAGKTGMEKSPIICFITANKDEVASWISAGELFEDISLALTKENISNAMHAGIVEVSLINQMFAATLGTTRKILALFRIGYVKKESDANRPHSPRYTIEQILI